MTYVDAMSMAVRIHVSADNPLIEEGVVNYLRGVPSLSLSSGPYDGSADLRIVVTAAGTGIEPAGTDRVPVILVVEPAPLAELTRLIRLHPVVAVLARPSITRQSLTAAVTGVLTDRSRMEAAVISDAVAIAVAHSDALTAAGDKPWLTDREKAVLTLMADGYETEEVALELNYSTRTIKNILRSVTVRAGLRSRTHAVAWAIREGLI